MEITVQHMEYNHTQKSPLDDLLFVVAAAAVVSAWAFRSEPAVMWLLLGLALMMALVGLCFGHLTVRDEGGHLAIRYGPTTLRIWQSSWSRESRGLRDGRIDPCR